MFDLVKAGIELDDGEVRHANSPKTFQLPSLASRQSVQVGDFVQAIFELPELTERMWCLVVEVMNPKGKIRVTLNNDPCSETAIKHGDEFEIEARHIIDVMTPTDVAAVEFFNKRYKEYFKNDTQTKGNK
jgi:hypothetical protein